MRLYLTGAFEHMDTRVGFGNASYHIYRSLRELGLDPQIKDLNSFDPYEADIEISFDQPSKYSFMCPTSYKIGYTPWESTGLMPGWINALSNVDEIWSPCQWNGRLFAEFFPDKPSFVYQHGLDHKYRPKKRKYDPEKPFTFLFIGEPYYRKGGEMVARAFIELFGDDPSYRLIIKCTHINTIVVERNGVSGPPDALYENITVMKRMLPASQVLQLYEAADVFVYPTWGEGFGFNPLQAMGMGIPTITTTAWSDYADYITVPISSNLTQSPWQSIHPGDMMKPNYKELRHAMSVARSNHQEWCNIAFKNSFRLHEEFDWLKVTQPTVDRLQKIYENLSSKTLTC